MPISASELKYYLSGGTTNTDPNQATGGAISTTEVGAGLHNLFDVVTGAESNSGDTEYRCIYIKNTNATLTLTTASFQIHSDSSSPTTSIEIGLGAAAKNASETDTNNEQTAPGGVTFGTGSVSLPDLNAGDYQAVWIKRIINASSPAFDDDTATIKVVGDTPA